MESDLVNEQRRTGCKLALEVLTGQAVLVRCSDVVKKYGLSIQERGGGWE